MASSLLAVDDNIDEFSDFESAQALESLENKLFQDTAKIVCGDARTETNQSSSDKGSCNSVGSLKVPVTCSSSETLIGNDINQLLQDTFPFPDNDGSQVEIIDLDQNCGSHWLWSKLGDVDCKPQQQWEDSRSFQLMLRSLNIDSRNILQLSTAPIVSHLELKETTLLKNPKVEQEIYHKMPDFEFSLPEVDFDWTSSEMTNPLEDELCLMDTIDDPWDISIEHRNTVNVIYNFKTLKCGYKLEFPDLSFMQSKILSIPFQRNSSNQYRVV